MGFLGSWGKGLKGAFNFVDPNAGVREANRFGTNKLYGIIRAIDQQRAGTKQAYGSARTQQRKAIPITQRAYAGARANIAHSANATKQQVAALQPAAMAASDASLFGSGHGASNLVGLSHRGIMGDTARALSEIDRMYAQQFGDLGIGEANALSGIQSGLAGLDIGLASELQRLLGMEIGARSSRQHTADGGLSSWVKSYGGLFGGMGGGGVGVF